VTREQQISQAIQDMNAQIDAVTGERETAAARIANSISDKYSDDIALEAGNRILATERHAARTR
jgi:hypothetical protein